MKEKSLPIGRGSATERQANSSERFQFWINPDELVNPFDIVVAEHYPDQSTQEISFTYGLVTNIKHSTNIAEHLTSYQITADFQDTPKTMWQGINIAEALVLSNSHDIYMPIQTATPIYFADEEEIHKALGIDNIPEERRIPAGLIQMSNGTRAATYLDSDFILGPNSAHVNISGVSGLAAKTSYAMFLIQSILQRSRNENIAAILINVSQDDLLYIHEPRVPVSPQEIEAWKQLGLWFEAWPQDRVHYLLPWGKNTQATDRPNSFGDELPSHQIYAYTFRETISKLDLLFSEIFDSRDSLNSIISEIQTGVESQDRAWNKTQTWDDLLTGPPLVQQGIPQKFRGLNASNVGRFIRMLRQLVKTHQSGIFVPQPLHNMTTIKQQIGGVKGGHTYVVDIARLNREEQTLVFGDVLRTIYGLYSGETLPSDKQELPKKVIIFVEELNRFAPRHSRGSQSPILELVLDIIEQGRSFGIILFATQQLLTTVDPQIINNSATKIFGRSSSVEINEALYKFLDQDVRNHLTRFHGGELLLLHPLYRQPVKITFPQPPFRQGHIKR